MYKLISHGKSASGKECFNIENMETKDRKVVSRDQLCFLVGKAEVADLSGQLYQGKVIIRGLRENSEQVQVESNTVASNNHTTSLISKDELQSIVDEALSIVFGPLDKKLFVLVKNNTSTCEIHYAYLYKQNSDLDLWFKVENETNCSQLQIGSKKASWKSDVTDREGFKSDLVEVLKEVYTLLRRKGYIYTTDSNSARLSKQSVYKNLLSNVRHLKQETNLSSYNITQLVLIEIAHEHALGIIGEASGVNVSNVGRLKWVAEHPDGNDYTLRADPNICKNPNDGMLLEYETRTGEFYIGVQSIDDSFKPYEDTMKIGDSTSARKMKFIKNAYEAAVSNNLLI